MATLLPELIIGPLLVGGSTLAARRGGARVGGLVSAFPAVVGPVLLITAQERGDLFAARAANGTLLGLVALSGFVLVYARLALRTRWPISLLGGWICAALAAVLVGWAARGDGLAAGLAAAIGSLMLAFCGMPLPARTAAAEQVATTDDLVLRMALTALLVASLASAAVMVGPLVGGMLAALPILASVLAVFTHRRAGPEGVVTLLRGMVVGMSGFVAFCTVITALIVPLGTAAAFAAATVTALLMQLLGLAPEKVRQAAPMVRVGRRTGSWAGLRRIE